MTIISVIISVPFINIVKITDDFTRGNDIMKSLSLTFVSNIVNVIRGIVTFYLQIRSARRLQGPYPQHVTWLTFTVDIRLDLSLVLSPGRKVIKQYITLSLSLSLSITS